MTVNPERCDDGKKILFSVLNTTLANYMFSFFQSTKESQKMDPNSGSGGCEYWCFHPWDYRLLIFRVNIFFTQKNNLEYRLEILTLTSSTLSSNLNKQKMLKYFFFHK
jgi:hypothetical protein